MAQQLFQQSAVKSAEIPSGPADFLMSRSRSDSTSEGQIGWNLEIPEQSEVTGAK